MHYTTISATNGLILKDGNNGGDPQKATWKFFCKKYVLKGFIYVKGITTTHNFVNIIINGLDVYIAFFVVIEKF